MKTVGIGIFIILVMGLIFFTIQIVKQADFNIVPAPQTKAATLLTFADIQSNIVFQYPDSWDLQYANAAAQFAPVFRTGSAQSGESVAASGSGSSATGYFAVSRKDLKRYPTAAEDFEFYSEDKAFKSFLNEVVLKDLANTTGGTDVRTSGRNLSISPIEDDEIKIEKNSKLTLKSGVPGFIVEYSVGNIRGTVYYLYSRDALQMVISAFAGNQPAVVAGGSGVAKLDPQYTKFKADVDTLMNAFVTI